MNVEKVYQINFGLKLKQARTNKNLSLLAWPNNGAFKIIFE
jgi:hypothetical protein